MDQSRDDASSDLDLVVNQRPHDSALKFVLLTFVLPMAFVLALAAIG